MSGEGGPLGQGNSVPSAEGPLALGLAFVVMLRSIEITLVRSCACAALLLYGLYDDVNVCMLCELCDCSCYVCQIQSLWSMCGFSLLVAAHSCGAAAARRGIFGHADWPAL